MKYQAALFDLDGTLTDSGEGIIQTGICAAKEMGYPIPERSELLKSRGPSLIWTFTTIYGRTEEEALELIKLYRKHYITVGPKYTTLFDGIPQMLQKVKDAGIRLFVCTAKYEAHAQMMCETFGIDSYFEKIYGTGDPELHETKAQIIEKILKERGLEKKDAVMIGDKDMDMIAGKTAGVDTIGAAYGYAAEGELENEHPTFIVPTVEAIGELLLSE